MSICHEHCQLALFICFIFCPFFNSNVAAISHEQFVKLHGQQHNQLVTYLGGQHETGERKGKYRKKRRKTLNGHKWREKRRSFNREMRNPIKGKQDIEKDNRMKVSSGSEGCKMFCHKYVDTPNGISEIFKRKLRIVSY